MATEDEGMVVQRRTAHQQAAGFDGFDEYVTVSWLKHHQLIAHGVTAAVFGCGIAAGRKLGPAAASWSQRCLGLCLPGRGAGKR